MHLEGAEGVAGVAGPLIIIEFHNPLINTAPFGLLGFPLLLLILSDVVEDELPWPQH